MRNFILQVKEPNIFINSFDTREEAKESRDLLELQDRETNSNLEYEIILREDYIENLKTELKVSIGTLRIKERVIWMSIKEDLEEFTKTINKLI